MRILVHPVMKKLPHPQDGSNSGIDDIPNPKAGQQWNAPTEEFETPLNTMAYCVGMMYARLYCYCNWLSKFSLRHPLLRLTRVPSQFSLHWVGSLNSLPNCLQMMLQLTLFKALVTRGYPHQQEQSLSSFLVVGSRFSMVGSHSVNPVLTVDGVYTLPLTPIAVQSSLHWSSYLPCDIFEGQSDRGRQGHMVKPSILGTVLNIFTYRSSDGSKFNMTVPEFSSQSPNN